MAPIVESVEVNRRPEEVFAYLDDLTRHKEWDDQIVETHVETDGPTRVGTRATDTRKTPMGKQKIAYEISEHDPPRRIVLADLVRDLLLPHGRLSRVGRARADPCRPVGLDVCLDDLVVPLLVPGEVVQIGEDLLGTPVDLDAFDDRCHPFLLSRVAGI